MKFLSDHRRLLSLLAHRMIIRCDLRSQAMQWLSSCRLGEHLDIPQLLLHTQRMGIEFSALAQLSLIQWRRRVLILQPLLHTHLVDILCSLYAQLSLIQWRHRRHRCQGQRRAILRLLLCTHRVDIQCSLQAQSSLMQSRSRRRRWHQSILQLLPDTITRALRRKPCGILTTISSSPLLFTACTHLHRNTCSTATRHIIILSHIHNTATRHP